jgi:endonuclease/exonuclease/phosphatase family metal-dependent hydrolase
VYQSNVAIHNGGYGNLVLSRWPVASRHRILLRQGARKPRGAQLLLIESPEGPLHLVHTHLGLAERERHWQMNRLLGHMLFRSADNLPTMVVGDFNDWRDTLADAGLAANGFAQVTRPAGKFRSFPAWLTVGALDKAFVRGPIAVRQARIVRTSLAKTASDHLPLVIDFHLDS